MIDRLHRLAAWLLVPLLLVLGSLGRVCWCTSLHNACEKAGAERSAGDCCDSPREVQGSHEASPGGDCCCFGTAPFLDQAPGDVGPAPAPAPAALPAASLEAWLAPASCLRPLAQRAPDRYACSPPLRVLHCTYRI